MQVEQCFEAATAHRQDLRNFKPNRTHVCWGTFERARKLNFQIDGMIRVNGWNRHRENQHVIGNTRQKNGLRVCHGERVAIEERPIKRRLLMDRCYCVDILTSAFHEAIHFKTTKGFEMTQKTRETQPITQQVPATPASASKPALISRLGRGLGSLIPAAAPAVHTGAERSTWNIPKEGAVGSASAAIANTVAPGAASSAPQAGTAILELDLSFIARNVRQPREKFDERAIATLADSIAQHGLIQPIVVRKLTLPVAGKTYELVAGERRLRAFEKLGRSKIPTITVQADEAASAVLALIENVQREDLNPLERAVALKRLITDFSWTQQQAAEKVGIDRASVANLLRLIELDPFTSGCVREGRLSQGHAKALLAIENVQARRAIAEKALHDEWSVRQVEREVQRIKSASGLTTPPVTQPSRKGSAQVADLERRLGQFIGSKVQIKQGRKAGTGVLSVSYYSFDQFDGILQRLGFDSNSLKD